MNGIGTFIVWGLLFLSIFLSGSRLSRAGRPLNVAVSTTHKLISLAAGILLLVKIYWQSRVGPLGTTIWIVVVLTGVCFLGSAVSGALLSSDKPPPAAVSVVHKVAPVLTVLAAAATLYLLPGS